MLRLRYSGTRGYMLAMLLLRDPSAEIIWHKARCIRGQIASYQAAALYLLARQYDKPTACILNIGCAWGYSTAVLAVGAPSARVTTLETLEKRVKKARRHLSRYQNVNLVQARSWDYLARDKTTYDMVFVDGCHRSIRKDMPFFNRLKVSGLFVSHDYVPWKFEQVVKELDGLRDQLGRPYDVRLVDDKERGIVGLYRRRGDKWID